MQEEDPVIGGMTYHPDWKVTVDDTPGIGADIEQSFLGRFDASTITS